MSTNGSIMNSSDWNGEGTPPVGTVCAINNGSGWRTGCISYIGSGFVVWTQLGDIDVPEIGCFVDRCRFSPLSAPKQIEKEERQAGAKAIIDRHMTEAFNEIREALGETPISVSLNIQPLQTMGDTHATGVYAGCDISFSE